MEDLTHTDPEMLAEERATIERSLGLVRELAHEVDPRVRVTLDAYRWHGDWVLDIGMALGHEEHHLQVTAPRLDIIDQDPSMLLHDLEGAIEDMRRHTHGETSEAGVETELGPLQEPPMEGGIAARVPPAHVAPPPPAPTPDGAAHSQASPEPIGAPAPGSEAALAEPVVSAAPAGTGHAAEAHQVPIVTPEDRRALDGTITLARHMAAELDPEASLAFEEYLWHGEWVLDIVVRLGEHLHHFEVTTARAHILVADPQMLEHDLEGVLRDLRRELAVHH